MSEEFDKEAEREKLREKYEKDEQRREETQRMSELLLQGATMTNEHCGNCGDPLFRDGGETFCPTCGGERAEAEGETAEQSQQQAVEGSQQPDQPQPPQQATRTAEDAQQPSGERANGTVQAEQPTRSEVDRREQATGSVEQQSTPQETTARPASTGDDPRAELQRAVTRAARKANEATDPRTAKQWLEASKEAAEALEALER